MDVGRVHGLLWVVRELRRGERLRARRRAAGLPRSYRRLLDLPLADLCLGLATRLHDVVDDPRAADACVRFYGLGRLPENLHAIAATLPRACGDSGALKPRRVEQLVEAAEEALAADLAATPLGIVPRPSDPTVDAVFAPAADRRHRLEVLLRAWADVPEGDHQSAAALLNFERESGLRDPDPRGGRGAKLHREARRRLRARAHAVLTVSVQRGGLGHRRRDVPTVGLSVDLLLGPYLLAADRHVWPALDEVFRATGSTRRPDAAALDIAAAYAHGLAQADSPHAAAVLGAVRRAVTMSPGPVPAGLATRVLVSSVVLARLHDDPAGFPAAAEALRISRLGLTTTSDPAEAKQLTSGALRALQELAELYERFGLVRQAERTLDEAYELLHRRGDPDQEEEPDGWLQQLLFSQGYIQRRGARRAGEPRPLRWLTRAQVAEARSADLVHRCDLLPREWGISAEAVLADLVVDEVEGHLGEGNARSAARAGARARRIIDGNEAGWCSHGAPSIAMARSARLTVMRAASRLALVTGDHDGYLGARERISAEVGPWLLPHDVEALHEVEQAAELRGIPRLGLAGRAAAASARVGQRTWAAS